MRCPFAEWIPSPNYTKGRVGVFMRVEHTTVGSYSAAVGTLTNPTRQASAHFIVSLEGWIAQLVDTDDTAWHCGNWPMNQRSIGIEHVDNGRYWDAVRTPELYAASAKLQRWIGQIYGLAPSSDTMQGHRQFSATACPDALDIDRIIREIGGTPEVPSQAEWDAFIADYTNRQKAVNDVLAQLAHAKHPEHVLDPNIKATLRRLDKIPDFKRLAPRKRPTAAQVRAGHGRGR